MDIDDQTRTEIEAAVFRKMIAHFQTHPEVQNIDLMNLGYFCRNCFSKWYSGAAKDRDVDINYDQAREVIYGMPFSDYKSQHQQKASEEQLAKFEKKPAKSHRMNT